MKKSQNKASTKDIVDAVRTELQKEADKLKQRPVKQRYNTSIEKFCDNVLKMMENIKKSQDLEADDFNTIKSTMLEKLQATFEQIKVMQSG
jgi:Tfp pilus assembly protein PilP